ncbi:unnamed protein product, partial [Darwinula stevensoni]
VMQTDPKANTAKVVGRGEHKRINTALVGHVNIGDWLLIFMNDAREILSPQRAQEIDATLNMVEAAMQGQVEQRLVNDFAAQWLDESNIDAFVNADGDHVLFLMGDTHRFAQGLDVAVVLPELQSMHPQRFDIGVVRKEAEDAIAKRFASRSWPALIFVRQVISELGIGSQAAEGLDYTPMPKGMQTYHAPVLPEPEEAASCQAAKAALTAVLLILQTQATSNGAAYTAQSKVHLNDLDTLNLALINQVLGEGEVAATVSASENTIGVHVQESVFTGVWRVLDYTQEGTLQDYIEIGPIPRILREVALIDAQTKNHSRASAAELPQRFLGSVGPLLTEIHEKSSYAQSLAEEAITTTTTPFSHTINLSLLPLGIEDISYLDHSLGTGRVTILSRGYGNCRITNTLTPETWRLVYYNSQDIVILNAVEITKVPEVACAAIQDLEDSAERLAEVLAWLGQDE